MNKEENVLTVLMYLFKHHMQENCLIDSDEEKLIEKLEEIGFRRPTIYKAFDWLTNLAELDNIQSKTAQTKTIRVFSEEECLMFDVQSRNFLMSLEKQGILSPLMRETVINQVIYLEQEGVDINLIKWVTLMVLFNQPKSDSALSLMELMVLDESRGGIH
jgi:Smg protein